MVSGQFKFLENSRAVQGQFFPSRRTAFKEVIFGHDCPMKGASWSTVAMSIHQSKRCDYIASI